MPPAKARTEGDYVVIGGGIAGAAAAYFLAARGRVVLLERESRCGYHTTGRSVATFLETYGNESVRALTRASRRFFEHPPPGFTASPLVSARSSLVVAAAGDLDALRGWTNERSSHAPALERLDPDACCDLVPILRRGQVAAGVLEPDAADIDVNALHQGFLTGARRQGATVVTDAEVSSLEYRGECWRAGTGNESYAAPVVVNAAGAWCDVVAGMAGVRPLGLQPKRRTVIGLDIADGIDCRRWPQCGDVGESFYFKPDAGRLLVSPADETDSEPCDAQAEDWDVAVAADRMQRWTTVEVRRIPHRWAGLRSFVADRTPVAGFDAGAPGFFWLAGQGGYGIQTSPALGRMAAALASGAAPPADIVTFGVDAALLSPERPSLNRIQPDVAGSSWIPARGA